MNLQIRIEAFEQTGQRARKMDGGERHGRRGKSSAGAVPETAGFAGLPVWGETFDHRHGEIRSARTGTKILPPFAQALLNCL